jgi:hypothetical protein
MIVYIKVPPNIWTLILDNLFIYCDIFSSFLFHFTPVISSKSLLLLLQELPTKSVFFDRSSPNAYSSLSSYQYCKFIFYLDY